MLGREIIQLNTIKNKNIFFYPEHIKDLKPVKILTKEPLIELESKSIKQEEKGYKFIKNKPTINKENLKSLYKILSENQLDRYSMENMGKYYRKRKVYLTNNKNLISTTEGVQPKEINKMMNQLFTFINSNNLENSTQEQIIKSQIIHYYFMYIHPYYDVNGRTSRMVSLWYLISRENYTGMPFINTINNDRRAYVDSIIKSKKTGNITYFLEYMLNNINKEIKKL